MEEIKGYKFDLQQKIYLQTAKNKFWEVLIEDAEVTYRAGVRRGEEEHKIKEVNKLYDSNTLARATVMTKIAGKIDKGYFSTNAEKV
jgi:predicted DNA-binding WGR domain protein